MFAYSKYFFEFRQFSGNFQETQKSTCGTVDNMQEFPVAQYAALINFFLHYFVQFCEKYLKEHS